MPSSVDLANVVRCGLLGSSTRRAHQDRQSRESLRVRSGRTQKVSFPRIDWLGVIQPLGRTTNRARARRAHTEWKRPDLVTHPSNR